MNEAKYFCVGDEKAMIATNKINTGIGVGIYRSLVGSVLVYYT